MIRLKKFFELTLFIYELVEVKRVVFFYFRLICDVIALKQYLFYILNKDYIGLAAGGVSKWL